MEGEEGEAHVSGITERTPISLNCGRENSTRFNVVSKTPRELRYPDTMVEMGSWLLKSMMHLVKCFAMIH